MGKILLTIILLSYCGVYAQEKTSQKRINSESKISISEEKYNEYLRAFYINRDFSGLDEMIQKNYNLNPPTPETMDILLGLMYLDAPPVYLEKAIKGGAKLYNSKADFLPPLVYISTHEDRKFAEEYIEILINNGADPSRKSADFANDVDVDDSFQNFTVLDDMICDSNRSSQSVLVVLTSPKANVNNEVIVPDSEGENTKASTLAIALSYRPNDYQIVKALIDKGADVNYIIKFENGEEVSILKWADYSNASSQVKDLLIQHGAQRYEKANSTGRRYITLGDLYDAVTLKNVLPSNKSEGNSSNQNNNTHKERVKQKTHIEFREVRSGNCSQGTFQEFKVYKNGEKYSTITVGDFKDKFWNGCAYNTANLIGLQTSTGKSGTTLKQFLILLYKTASGSADSYTLTTK